MSLTSLASPPFRGGSEFTVTRAGQLTLAYAVANALEAPSRRERKAARSFVSGVSFTARVTTSRSLARVMTLLTGGCGAGAIGAGDSDGGVHPSSAAFMATIGVHELHLDLGPAVDQTSSMYWGIPYNVVHGSTMAWSKVPEARPGRPRATACRPG